MNLKPMRVVAASALAAGLFVSPLFAGEFRGWEAMRVIRLEGNPAQLRPADLDGDGRDELIVVNTRQARLDLYEWITPDQREEAVEKDPDRPNELPMAPEFRHEEIPLDELPRDLIVHDVDGDGRSELILLSAPPNRVIIYAKAAESESGDDAKWSKRESYDLLPGEFAGFDRLMLLRDTGKSKQLLISCAEGIQTLTIQRQGGNAAAKERASWMQPRERVARMKWWLGDLDGDGDQDVVEWTRQPRQTVRWYESVGEQLLPAQVLYEEDAAAVETVIGADGGMEVLLLGGLQEGLLRRYEVGQSEASPIGRLQALPVGSATKAVWAGMKLDDQPALVLVDSAQPRLLAYMLTDAGWQLKGDGYPIITKVKSIAAPQARPGTVLLWAEDATDLHISTWDDGRLTYPKLMPQSEDIAERSIVALSTAGRTTWWAQKVGKNLDLYVWEPTADEPTQTRFEGLGEKADKIAWLGGKRLLVHDKHARSPKLAVIDDEGKTVVTEPSHLRTAKIEDFALYGEGAERRLGKISEGVLQWLDESLNPIDQIMLPEGQALASYVPVGDNGEAWALAAGGQFMHKLENDEAGLPHVIETHRIHFGSMATSDPVLGLLLLDNDRITRLSAGAPQRLTLTDSIDGRVGRRSGVREATIHRIMTTDVTGDGHEDVLIADDQRHHLTVLGQTEEKMQPIIAWSVFEDKAYPYGGGRQEHSSEPRVVVALELDGDGNRDIALLSHDRLIFYIAKKESQ